MSSQPTLSIDLTNFSESSESNCSPTNDLLAQLRPKKRVLEVVSSQPAKVRLCFLSLDGKSLFFVYKPHVEE